MSLITDNNLFNEAILITYQSTDFCLSLFHKDMLKISNLYQYGLF